MALSNRLPTLHALGSLTALILYQCCPNLPPGLSTLTSLRYLRAGCSSREPLLGAISLEDMRHLPQLEWLSIRQRGLAALPLHVPGLLRVLDMYGNTAAIPANAHWLASLEQLGCNLAQVDAAL